MSSGNVGVGVDVDVGGLSSEFLTNLLHPPDHRHPDRCHHEA